MAVITTDQDHNGPLFSLQYGTRHILETLTKEGYNIRVLHACGSLAKNPVFMQTCADVTGKYSRHLVLHTWTFI